MTVDDWELPKSEFTLEGQLGSGYFAEVHRGKWKGMVNVAIKILKNNGMSCHVMLCMNILRLSEVLYTYVSCHDCNNMAFFLLSTQNI